MSKSQQDLIREEQRILDKLINELDQVMLKIDKKYTYSSLQAKKAKEQCLPDTYGALIAANHDQYAAFREKKRLKRVRNELYDTRIVVDCTDDHSTEEEEIKIGLHTYAKFDKLYVVSWVRPVCRNYILDNCKEEYDGVVEKGGVQYKTHFKLKLKRRIDMYFDKVKDVSQLYPLVEEAEEIIADEFLQEQFRCKSFRRKIEKLVVTKNTVVKRVDYLIMRHTRIDSCRLYATSPQLCYLVFHQGYERSDNDTYTIHGHGRYLKTDGLTASSRHKSKCVVTLTNRGYDFLLYASEGIITPVLP